MANKNIKMISMVSRLDLLKVVDQAAIGNVPAQAWNARLVPDIAIGLHHDFSLGLLSR